MDDQQFGDLHLKLRLQVVRDGQESRVLELVSRAADGGPTAPDDLPGRAVSALKILRSLGPDGATHGEWLRASGLKKATFNRALSDLLAHDMIARVGHRYIPTSPETKPIQSSLLVSSEMPPDLSGRRSQVSLQSHPCLMRPGAPVVSHGLSPL